MHSIILWTVVFVVGVPVALWNPTTFALVLAKYAGYYYFQRTGNNLPVEFYTIPDVAVIGIILAKREAYNIFPYRNRWHQLGCLLTTRSIPDRIVLIVFAAMWPLYVMKVAGGPLHEFYIWWLLWAGVIIQFLAAGYEGYAKMLLWLRSRRVATRIIDTHLCEIIPFPIQRCDADAAQLLTVSVGVRGSG